MFRKFLLLFLFLTTAVLATVRGDKPTAVAADTTNWQPVSSPTGGSIAAVALSPHYTQDQTAYAAVRGRGVYRSEDGGFKWQPAGPDGWYVTDLLLSPDFPNDETLFALTGLPTTSSAVQRSQNGGLTWETATFSTTALNGQRLVISPDFATDQTVYMVTGTATYVSTDGGGSFSAAGGWFADHSVASLAFATDQVLFAAAANATESGLYRSDNGGANWNLVRSGDFTAVSASPAYTSDETVLALDSAGQLHRSDNGGAGWTTPALTVSDGRHTIAFSPTFSSDQTVMAAGSLDGGPYRSTDGGLTWEPADWYDPADTFNNGLIGGAVFDLALAPNQGWDGVVLAGTSIGIARSAYGGDQWRQANQGLPTLAVSSLAAAPGDANTLLAGTTYFETLPVTTGSPGQYDGNIQLSRDGGQTWRVVTERLQQVTAVAFSPTFASDDTAFAAAGTIGQHGFFDGGVYRSTDGGDNWQEVLAHKVISGLAVSPHFAADHTVWAAAWTYSGSSGVYRSSNGGSTWTAIAPALPATTLYVLFAATTGGLQKSSSGGASWAPVGPTEAVTAVALSPLYGASQTLVMTTANAVYRSTNGGASWSTLTIGLPATQSGQPLRLDSVSFAADGSLMVGGAYGSLAGSAFARRSTDGGATWTAVGSSLAAAEVSGLLTQPTHSFLVTAAADTGLHQLTIEQGAAAEPGIWSSSGPRGGRALALAVSPDFANDGIALGGEWQANFQGSANGLGLIKSGDFGQTWQRKPTAVDYSQPVLDYGFSPAFAADDTVYAATWGDVLKSTDGGETWAATGARHGTVPGFFYTVAADDSGLVLAGADYYGEALYVSRDGGASWEDAQAVSASGAILFSPDFAADDTVFAAGWEGVSKSDTAALSWTPVFTGVVRALAVSPDFASDQTLFAGAVKSAQTAAFYRSGNGGGSWISRTIAADVTSVNALAVSPAFPADQTLFAGTNAGLYWSADAGDTWTAVPDYAQENVHTLAISPGWPGHAVLLVGLDSGVYRLLSANPAAGVVRQPSQHFAALNTNPLALTANGVLLTATADHFPYSSSDGGATWHALNLGGGSFYSFSEIAASPNYGSDQTLFAAWVRGDGIGSSLYRSQNGGDTWTSVLSADFVGDVLFSPAFATDETVIAATNDQAVKRSTDGGDTWSNLGTWPVSKTGTALQLALPPTYPADKTIFAGGARGFWWLPPGGTTWQTAVSGITENHRIITLAVSPAYSSDHILLALASWSNPSDFSTHYGVFTTSDSGAHWSRVGAGLPDAPLVGLALSPAFAADQTAYVTTEAGELYRSRDGGGSWTAVGSAPGRPGFADVVVDGSGAVVVASRAGVWRYTTPQVDSLINGGFETEAAWQLPGTPKPAYYSSEVVYSGQHALQVGSFSGANGAAYSSARQTVHIPAGTQTAQLTLHLYAVSGESTQARETAVFTHANAAAEVRPAGAAGGDAQYLLLIDPKSNAILDTLFWELSNSQRWQTRTFDLSPYAGQDVLLHLGVYNDGGGGQTGMVVDQMALLVDATIDWPYDLYLPLVTR